MVTTLPGSRSPRSKPPEGSIVSDDLDFPFGRLEYGLQGTGAFVFAIEQHTPMSFLAPAENSIVA